MATRVYNGFVYSQSAPGEPWVKQGPAAPQAQAPVAIPLPRSPSQIAEERRKEEDQQIQRETATRADERARQAEARADAAEARARENDADKQRTLQARGGVESTESERTAAFLATRLAGGLRDLQSLGNLGAPSLKDALAGGTLLGNYTTDESRQRAINAQREIIDSALTIGTGAAYTAEQIESYRKAYFAQPGDQPGTIADKNRRLQTALNAAKLKAGASAGLIDQALLPPSKADDGQKQLSSAGKFERDPALAGTNARVSALIKSGSSAEEIKAYLNSIRPGLAANVGGIDEAVTTYRKHPEAEVNVDVEKAWKPAGAVSQTLGDIGLSPVGTGLIGAADVLSMGTLDNFTGNPQETRDVMGGVKSVNPGSYFAGQMGGGVIGALAGGGLVGTSGLSAARSGLVSDALMGGGYGAGSADGPDDSRVAQALLGAGLGAGGNKVGSVASALLGKGLTGVTDTYRKALHKAGVRMTPGQVSGGVVKGIEDRLAGFPLVGDAINARRSEGIQDFDRATFDQALAPIGASTNGVIAEPGAQIAHDAVSQAYRDALGGQAVQTDPAYLAATNQLAGRVQGIPRVGEELYASMRDAIGPMIQNGQITGDSFQDIMQGVNTIRGGYKGTAMQAPDPLYATHIAPALNDYTSILEDLVERQSPGTVAALRAANSANRNVSTIDAAVAAAANRGGEFMPSQLMNASRANSNKFSGRRSTAEGRGPLFDIARAGQEVLPNQVPDSGTSGRQLIAPILAGSALGGGSYAAQGGQEGAGANSLATGAVVTALLATPYSRPARALVQEALLAERPKAITDLGQIALGNQRIAGLLGGAAAIPYAGN